MSLLPSDIIIAQSTPQGEGAIAVLRLSGAGCINLVDTFFKGKNLKRVASHTAHYGKIVDKAGDIIDECVGTVFIAPRSYTCEDVVEISCHGSNYIIKKIIELFIAQGARLAQPGEFTQRAFLNGQLDLSQAEAVADVIASENAVSHRIAMQQMRGGISKRIQHLRQELIDFAALIELELDFSEEDVTFANREKLNALILDIQREIQVLKTSFRLGNAIKKGIPVAIAGIPNAGKSTLLNALLNEDRAIVSDIAGTTRDTIDDVLLIHGASFRIIDTAGLRESKNIIEKIGIERTMDAVKNANILVYVIDPTQSTPTEINNYLENIYKVFPFGQRPKTILVLNKIDLTYSFNSTQIDESIYDQLILISAKDVDHIESLKETIYTVSPVSSLQDHEVVITSARHFESLQKADEHLTVVLEQLKQEVSSDFIAMDIRSALNHLGDITGEISTDDLLDSIFSRFCIGK